MSGLYGTETEFAVSLLVNGRHELDAHTAITRILRQLTSGENLFLANGARVYKDAGPKFEYAVPECDNLLDVVSHIKAGERIVESAALAAEQVMRKGGYPGKLFVIQNNVDSVGNTYGAHENYLIERQLPLEHVTAQIIPFFIVRQLLVGAGHVRHSGGKVRYCFSQRSRFMKDVRSSQTMRDRAIITNRDEPHADIEKYRRLHIIVGDANMSETTLMLKMGLTDLILRMVEAGERFGDLTMKDPIAVIDLISQDLTGQAVPIKLVDGREVTALWVLNEYVQRAKTFAAEQGLTDNPNVAAPLALAELGVEAIRTGDHTLVDRSLDWAIKAKMLGEYSEKHDIPLEHPRISQLDIAYHDTNRARGVYYLLEKRGLVDRFTTDLRIFQAKVTAPRTTRAHARGKGIAFARKNGIAHHANWSVVTFLSSVKWGVEQKVLLPEPRDPDATNIDAMIAKAQGRMDERLAKAAGSAQTTPPAATQLPGTAPLAQRPANPSVNASGAQSR